MNGYKVPNMNEGLNLMESTGSQDNRMLRILQNLNTPMNESVEDEDKKTATCPECGMTWTPDVTMEDGAGQVCPGCGHICNVEGNVSDAQMDDEPTITESEDEDEENEADDEDKVNESDCEDEKDESEDEDEEKNESCDEENESDDEDEQNEAEDEDEDKEKLEESLQRYVGFLNKGNPAGAKAILESCGATAICDSKGGIMLEKFVIKVGADGKKVKKKVRTKKVKRTPAQKAALRKARKAANKGAAKKKRKKAMKARARMGMTESLRKTRTINAVRRLAESSGFHFNTKALEKAINEAYNLHEAEIINDEENVQSTLETNLRNKGIEIKESEVEVIDGVIVVHLSVTDTDSDIFLGDIADEIGETLHQYDVDYDEPEEDEDGMIFIDFYFVPLLTSESCECDDEEKNEADDEDEDEPKNESEDEDEEKDESEDEDEEEKQVNESVRLFAGGASNVRCKLNPAFIKPGQVIFDADEKTVFTALTESVAHKGGYSLAVEIQNSKNPNLASLASGAEIDLEASGRYFLLKNNPVK